MLPVSACSRAAAWAPSLPPTWRSGLGGEPGVVADGLVQVGGLGRVGGGDVLADRGQGAQPVPLAEGQPELAQHGRRGQPVVRQQRGQVLTGDPVGEHAQQAQQPPPPARSSAALVTEVSTETATLSSRRVPPIRASIPVRSACHRCATSARSGWPWAA